MQRGGHHVVRGVCMREASIIVILFNDEYVEYRKDVVSEFNEWTNEREHVALNVYPLQEHGDRFEGFRRAT
jgi:hypothetical protein